jgi:hypothetical protein
VEKQLYLNCRIDLIESNFRSYRSVLNINSSFLHRLLVWQYFHHIAQLFDCSLLLNESFWPEGLVLDLPNTKFVNSFYLRGKKHCRLDSKLLTKKVSHLLENYVVGEDNAGERFNSGIFESGTGAGGLTAEDPHYKMFYSKIFVYVDNILQQPDISYTFKGNRIFFTEAPKEGSKCYMVYFRGPYEDIGCFPLPETILDGNNISQLYPDQFLVFDSIEHSFDGIKTKFQISLTHPDFKQIAHSLLKPCVNRNNSIFIIDNIEYDILRFDCDCLQIIPHLFNRVYDRLIDFVNIHSDCAKTAGFFYNFREIEFKNYKVSKFITDNFTNVAGFQIRRGLGTYINKKYIEDLKQYVNPELIKKYYKHLYDINGGRGYLPIETDDYYFEKIDEIINKNPDKKIYLSHDVPKTFINHFIEKYPNNIITKHNYLEEYLNYFDEFDLEENDSSKISVKQYVFSFKKAIIDLLDLFALSHCDLLISKKHREFPLYSTWLFFTKCYNGKKII